MNILTGKGTHTMKHNQETWSATLGREVICPIFGHNCGIITVRNEETAELLDTYVGCIRCGARIANITIQVGGEE